MLGDSAEKYVRNYGEFRFCRKTGRNGGRALTSLGSRGCCWAVNLSAFGRGTLVRLDSLFPRSGVSRTQSAAIVTCVGR
jgi:hypothetical protein